MFENKKIDDIEDLQNKINSILEYLYGCDDFTQTYSSFYRDSCMSKQFRNYRGFLDEHSIILQYMKSIDLVRYWKCDKAHHSYYALTNKSLRKLNLDKLCQ